jgi:hypothetical protein
MEEQLRATLHKANANLTELERAQAQQRIAFEQELRAKYAQLVAEHQATVEAAQQHTLAQEVAEMQAKMHLEQERARVWEDVEQRCRKEYQEKYAQLLADVEAHWKKEVSPSPFPSPFPSPTFPSFLSLDVMHYFGPAVCGKKRRKPWLFSLSWRGKDYRLTCAVKNSGHFVLAWVLPNVFPFVVSQPK